MEENKTISKIPFKQWIAHFYNSAVQAGYSSYSMVLYIHFYSKVFKCLQADYDVGCTPDQDFIESKGSINEFIEIQFKRFAACKTIKEKAEWFDTRRPSARLLGSRWFPRIGGLVLYLIQPEGYNTKKAAIKAAKKFQCHCSEIILEEGMPNSIEQLAVFHSN